MGPRKRSRKPGAGAGGPRRPTPIAPARRLAFRVLLKLESPRRHPARPDTLLAALEASRENGSGDPERTARDRALARELVFGVLRWKRGLDYALDSYARKPVRTFDPRVRTALRLGLYQLRYLTRIPPGAAVHDAVALAAGSGGRGAGGLVNAVLRAYLRADHPWPHPRGDRRLYLRTGLSHPDWLVDRYLEVLGPERTRVRLEANNRRPVSHLRVSRGVRIPEARRRLRADGVLTERFPLAPRCLRVLRGNPQQSGICREGGVYVQDAGSQLIGWLLPPPRSGRVADLCAAPGGKATILAERMQPHPVFAADLRPPRAALLGRTARRLAADNLLCLAADAVRPPFADGTFARILVDAPCSGLGTLARNPDIKWTASAERVGALASTALRIVRRGARLLAPGGQLLYAVCSLEAEETEELVGNLLQAEEALRRRSLADRLPPRLRSLVTAEGALHLPPEAHRTDGYYAALLERPRGPAPT